MGPDQFQELVRTTKPVVLKAISRHLDRNLASCIDDVAQEVYLRVYKNLKSFRGSFEQERIFSWIYVIARNESFRMNVKMKKKREVKTETMEDLIPAKPADSDFLETEEEQSIYEAIALLPEKHRSIISLLVENLTVSEIAQKLSLSEGTVKSRIHRAREKLARILSTFESGEKRYGF